ncbi:MAG: hypothetical protein H6711_34370 [Myxococcales bacterium]|nr:hypothetical protein [Myxococcales bacterium]
MIRRALALALGGLAALAFACVEPNPDHCGNLKGDSTCAARSTSAPFCDLCTAVNNGCVAVEAADPTCRPAGAGATEASGSTSTGAATSTGEDASTGASASASASTGDTAGPYCGDGHLDPGELCDADDLHDATCVSLGYGGGDLACGEDCEFDASGCCLGVGAPCELNAGTACCRGLTCQVTGDLKEPFRCL